LGLAYLVVGALPSATPGNDKRKLFIITI